MTQLEHLKLGGPIEGLPDFDSLATDDLAKLAENARAEEAALERIYAALSEATVPDKLGMAALAILNVSECHVDPIGEKAALFSKVSSESLIGLAIAILEGLQSSEEEEG